MNTAPTRLAYGWLALGMHNAARRRGLSSGQGRLVGRQLAAVTRIAVASTAAAEA